MTKFSINFVCMLPESFMLPCPCNFFNTVNCDLLGLMACFQGVCDAGFSIVEKNGKPFHVWQIGCCENMAFGEA